MVIAFVPFRKGSKGILDKNIKDFCGKPLFLWVVEELIKSKVDKVVLATDYDKKLILSMMDKYHDWDKINIYERSEQSASDTASTEDVMLEYLNKCEELRISNPLDVFILCQVTNPFLKAEHIDEALKLYESGKFYSILSVVSQNRFEWKIFKNGNTEPFNYEYLKRPRRQDLKNIYFIENGSFYINHIYNILENKNRLSATKVCLYVMPEYSFTEIDTPDDWFYSEYLFKKYVLHYGVCGSCFGVVLKGLDDGYIRGVRYCINCYEEIKGMKLKEENDKFKIGNCPECGEFMECNHVCKKVYTCLKNNCFWYNKEYVGNCYCYYESVTHDVKVSDKCFQKKIKVGNTNDGLSQDEEDALFAGLSDDEIQKIKNRSEKFKLNEKRGHFTKEESEVIKNWIKLGLVYDGEICCGNCQNRIDAGKQDTIRCSKQLFDVSVCSTYLSINKMICTTGDYTPKKSSKEIAGDFANNKITKESIDHKYLKLDDVSMIIQLYEKAIAELEGK